MKNEPAGGKFIFDNAEDTDSAQSTKTNSTIVGQLSDFVSSRRGFLSNTAKVGVGAAALGGLGTGVAAAQELPLTLAIGEVGVEFNNQTSRNEWSEVQFDNVLVESLATIGELIGGGAGQPIVTMKPVSFKGSSPCHVRLRNVTSSGFEYRIEEWDYLDGGHRSELMQWVAIAPVAAQIDTVSGATTNIEAQRVSATTDPTSVDFSLTFADRPVVIPQVQTYNGKGDAVIARLGGGVENTGFTVFLQEQESNTDNGNYYHRAEEVGYIASEVPTGGGILDILGLAGPVVTEFEARRPTKSVGDSPDTASRIPFTLVNNGEGFSRRPRVVSALQTRRGPETAELRRTDLTRNHMDLFVEEERSQDRETNHAPEDIGFIAFGSNGLIPGSVVDITL